MTAPDRDAPLAAAPSRLPLGEFVLDFGAQALRGADGKAVELRPQAWAMLAHLALNAGRLGIVWTARHDAGSATVLAERDALVQRIAGTLHASARHAEARSVLARPPKTLDAYALTARAVAMRSQFFRPEAFRRRAICSFRRLPSTRTTRRLGPTWLSSMPFMR